MVVGAAIGLWRARVVEMTGMPELIALLHSFVGLAAVLVGWNGYLHVEADPDGAEARPCEAQEPARHPLRRGVHRRLHRRGHLHRLDRGVPQALRPDQVQPADAARARTSSTSARWPRFARPDRLVRRRPAAVAAGRGHRSSRCCWAGTWSPPSAAATCRSWCRC